MSNSTNVNAFKQDVQDSLAKAHEALGEAEVFIGKLVEKLESDTVVQDQASQTTSVPPATVPADLTETNQTPQVNTQNIPTDATADPTDSRSTK